ncbi:MAG: hypothetical protein COS08_06975 [Euryarchaeota archaeon CG01_land_8_20_14_3_00_38_12]|nr:MAG: hypothetical protein COS08_06975 [Euryarchaeota archaeon CG01_land_8_20_14_3_00_38_12]
MKNVEEQIMQKKDMIVPSMYEIIEINGFKLEALMGGLIYMSMKIANNDVSFSDVVKWTYDRLEVKK